MGMAFRQARRWSMAVAVNLLVGSTCGKVYIVRCDPDAGTVTLKTSISAGTAPIQLLVDVPNKCFYCLDSMESDVEGRLLTLSPTEFGTIEETMSIGTGGQSPRCMMNVGKNILICHEAGYSVVESPIAPKSTRRRRTSTLAPVTENLVAESLDQLYSISKRMDGPETTEDPASAIANIEAHLYADSSVAVTELQSFVRTKRPILKFVQWQSGMESIVAMRRDGIETYSLTLNERLSALQRMDMEDVIDCEATEDSLLVLCRGHLNQVTIVSDRLNLKQTWELPSQDGISLKVLRDGNRAFILNETDVISLNLKTQEQKHLDIAGTFLTLSQDDKLLLVADGKRDTISMYDLKGEHLGSCHIPSPASIVHMS